MRIKYRRHLRPAKGRSQRRGGRLKFAQVAVPAALFGTFGGLVYTMATGGGPIVQADTGDSAAFTCTGAIVVDGDTLRCGSTRIRLQGIDAPEMPGHCRQGRACTPGDPYASTDNLRRLVALKTLQCRQTDIDQYGRVVARCAASEVDLSCAQVGDGHAVLRYAPISC